MRKSYLSPNANEVSPLESCVLGNGPAQFGKGATEKGRKAPRRCPTSFGEGRMEKVWAEIPPAGGRKVNARNWEVTFLVYHRTSPAAYSTCAASVHMG